MVSQPALLDRPASTFGGRFHSETFDRIVGAGVSHGRIAVLHEAYADFRDEDWSPLEVAGYSPQKVRRAMGHTALATTLQYSHLVRSDLEEIVGEDADRAELADPVG